MKTSSPRNIDDSHPKLPFDQEKRELQYAIARLTKEVGELRRRNANTESGCAAKLKEFARAEREASKMLLSNAREERDVAHQKREAAQKEIKVLETVSD